MTIPNRPAAVAIVLAAVLSALAGCGGGSGSRPEGQNRANGAAVLVGQVEPIQAGSLTAGQVAGDDTEFGFALFQKLCSAHPTSNVTLSPASAAEALGMLDAGSVGKTQAAVGKLLRLPTWGPALVAALHAQSDALGQVSQITVSNHVFERTGLSPTRQALNDLRTAYGADLRQLNFADEPSATNAINATISHDTAGMIPKLFDQPLDPGTETVLADAILLDAKWQQPFPTSQPGVFHTAAGGRVTTPLMQNPEGSFAARTANGWESVVLPYVGNLQAVAVLPPTSGCAVPPSNLVATLTSGPSQSVSVVLPKLTLSQTLPLTKVLAAMGLPLVGDFSGLGAGDSQISEVVQKVVMKVDEMGTKAAAATGIGIATSARLASPQTVTFDRPFLLMLENTATHTPLFLARVADPTQS